MEEKVQQAVNSRILISNIQLHAHIHLLTHLFLTNCYVHTRHCSGH